MAMASVAYVNHPEPHDPDIPYEMRYSASFYSKAKLTDSWSWQNSLIYGAVTHYDHADSLNSFSEEFFFSSGAPNLWGRIEVLQRTPAELGITASDPNTGRWVAALTLDYTHYLWKLPGATLGIGTSVSKDVLPELFASAYGGNPYSGRIFPHVKGMRMWDLF